MLSRAKVRMLTPPSAGLDTVRHALLLRACPDVLIERLKQFATMQRFFLAMNLHPDVQKKAQAELDAVVGPNRLPELSDRDQLPYVTAIVKETLRWYPAVPLGVAHCTVADDVYRGFFIPAGATVVVNSWCVQCHITSRFTASR